MQNPFYLSVRIEEVTCRDQTFGVRDALIKKGLISLNIALQQLLPTIRKNNKDVGPNLFEIVGTRHIFYP